MRQCPAPDSGPGLPFDANVDVGLFSDEKLSRWTLLQSKIDELHTALQRQYDELRLLDTRGDEQATLRARQALRHGANALLADAIPEGGPAGTGYRSDLLALAEAEAPVQSRSDTAGLFLETEPSAASFSIVRIEPVGEDPILTASEAPVFSGLTPIENLRLPRGSYIVSIEKEGRWKARVPVLVDLLLATAGQLRRGYGRPSAARGTGCFGRRPGPTATNLTRSRPAPVRLRAHPKTRCVARRARRPGGKEPGSKCPEAAMHGR